MIGRVLGIGVSVAILSGCPPNEATVVDASTSDAAVEALPPKTPAYGFLQPASYNLEDSEGACAAFSNVRFVSPSGTVILLGGNGRVTILREDVVTNSTFRCSLAGEPVMGTLRYDRLTDTLSWNGATFRRDGPAPKATPPKVIPPPRRPVAAKLLVLAINAGTATEVAGLAAVVKKHKPDVLVIEGLAVGLYHQLAADRSLRAYFAKGEPKMAGGAVLLSKAAAEIDPVRKYLRADFGTHSLVIASASRDLNLELATQYRALRGATEALLFMTEANQAKVAERLAVTSHPEIWRRIPTSDPSDYDQLWLRSAAWSAITVEPLEVPGISGAKALLATLAVDPETKPLASSTSTSCDFVVGKMFIAAEEKTQFNQHPGWLYLRFQGSPDGFVQADEVSVNSGRISCEGFNIFEARSGQFAGRWTPETQTLQWHDVEYRFWKDAE
ncbi:MAG: hypothetical protein IPG45_16280 [Deltaproteobacteria bacterium]|nr:hypothetical protein [Deltaproteobacteria bacterium]